MKRWIVWMTALMAATTLGLAGCGGGGGSKSAAAPGVLDRDGDGIPDAQDAFPDDPARFAKFSALALDGLSAGFGAAVAVSESNLIVGMSDDGGGSVKAVKWSLSGGAAGAPTALQPIAGNEYSAAYGIGEGGLAVGESQKGSDFVAVAWPAGPVGAQVPVELKLGSLGPPAAAYAADGSRIVGEAANAAGDAVALLWSTLNAAPVSLGSLPGGSRSAAYDIAGTRIVGESLNASGAARAVVWSLDASGNPGAPLALEPLPGHVSSVALCVNASGEVVGESESASGDVHAVLWRAGSSTAVDLGGGGAGAMNLDYIVGYSGQGASLWDPRNTALADAILAGTFAFSAAYDINESNVAVGYADGRGFVAVPQ